MFFNWKNRIVVKLLSHLLSGGFFVNFVQTIFSYWRDKICGKYKTLFSRWFLVVFEYLSFSNWRESIHGKFEPPFALVAFGRMNRKNGIFENVNHLFSGDFLLLANFCPFNSRNLESTHQIPF